MRCRACGCGDRPRTEWRRAKPIAEKAEREWDVNFAELTPLQRMIVEDLLR
jgi:hypothetical protein